MANKTANYQLETEPGYPRDLRLTAVLTKIETDVGVLQVGQETPKTVVTSYTVTVADRWIFVDATAAAVTIYLPPATCPHPLGIEKIDASANAVTVRAAGNDTIDGSGTISLAAQYDKANLVPNGSSFWGKFA